MKHLKLIENLKFKIKNYRRGFTLIELLVVIAIVGILVSIAIVNVGRNPDRDVRQEKDRLVTFLRKVQSNALTIEKVPGVSGKTCGFGVKMSGSNVQSYYVSTADLNADCSAMVATTGTNYVDIFVPRTSDTSITFNGLSLFFLTPHGEAYLNGSNFPAIFTITKSGQSITVEVEESGLIR